MTVWEKNEKIGKKDRRYNMGRMIKLHIEHLPEGVYLATSDEFLRK